MHLAHLSDLRRPHGQLGDLLCACADDPGMELGGTDGVDDVVGELAEGLQGHVEGRVDAAIASYEAVLATDSGDIFAHSAWA